LEIYVCCDWRGDSAVLWVLDDPKTPVGVSVPGDLGRLIAARFLGSRPLFVGQPDPAIVRLAEVQYRFCQWPRSYIYGLPALAADPMAAEIHAATAADPHHRLLLAAGGFLDFHRYLDLRVSYHRPAVDDQTPP